MRKFVREPLGEFILDSDIGFRREVGRDMESTEVVLEMDGGRLKLERTDPTEDARLNSILARVKKTCKDKQIVPSRKFSLL